MNEKIWQLYIKFARFFAVKISDFLTIFYGIFTSF